MKYTYEEEATNLSQAIDIAIKAFQKYPPEGFQSQHVESIISTYLVWKERILNPESQFRNLASLKHKTQDVLIFFQESPGKTADFFWNNVKEQNLPFKREHKLHKILTRKKIRNHAEYDYVIDTIVPFEQEGMITKENVNTLNELLADFENNKEVNHRSSIYCSLLYS